MNGPVLAQVPTGIVSDLPHVALGISKCPGRAAPLRQRCRTDDRTARLLGLCQHFTDFFGRADVVGEFDAGCTMSAESSPKAKHHSSGLEETDLVVGLLGTAPAERLVEGAGAGQVVDSEGHETDALVHDFILACGGTATRDASCSELAQSRSASQACTSPMWFSRSVPCPSWSNNQASTP